MMLYIAEVVYLKYHLLVPYLFKLMFLLTSEYMNHTYIVHHPLKIKLCHIINVTTEEIHKQI
ncbi:hypothetical protein F383_29748 [Gossypium arboreum]|uniref:Uncharacterized protein n=1 Tax=Gossypium arboreum TaxID=29729 RepID=A0A0B0PA84_GOSAR|nr:hypothetical protein F383_29748 [Gossypium arboreum]